MSKLAARRSMAAEPGVPVFAEAGQTDTASTTHTTHMKVNPVRRLDERDMTSSERAVIIKKVRRTAKKLQDMCNSAGIEGGLVLTTPRVQNGTTLSRKFLIACMGPDTTKMAISHSLENIGCILISQPKQAARNDNPAART